MLGLRVRDKFRVEGLGLGLAFANDLELNYYFTTVPSKLLHFVQIFMLINVSY